MNDENFSQQQLFEQEKYISDLIEIYDTGFLIVGARDRYTDGARNSLIVRTDKNGNFPWDEDCESYWPEMCPPPLAAMAQMSILGEDTLLTKLESAYKKINTDNS